MMKNVFYLSLALLIIVTLSLTACGGNDEEPADTSQAADSAEEELPKGDATAGKDLFTKTCSACHGPAGEGIEGLGKDMTTSEFIAGKTDVGLLEFIKVGRDPGDPLNTTGIAMLPKGGNPALTDENLTDIIAFIRSIQK